MENLRDQARDVQLLRVTKDLQLGLNEEGQRGKDQHDIDTLEKTLELNDRVSHTHKMCITCFCKCCEFQYHVYMYIYTPAS